MLTLQQVDGENVWDILNERGEVIRSHLEAAAARAEYERLTATVARRTLAHVSSHSEWLDGFRAGYLAARQTDDAWVRDRVERFAAPAAARNGELNIDPYDFGYWALGLLNGQPIHDSDRDSLIAGQVCFRDEGRAGKEKRVLVMAKRKPPTTADVRHLEQAMREADAEMGTIISADEPKPAALVAARGAGSYHSPLSDESYPRIQLLTVPNLLAGDGLNYPGVRRTLSGEPSAGVGLGRPPAGD